MSDQDHGPTSSVHHADHAAASHDDHGHGGTGKYWAVFFALCVLTAASFFTYSDAWPFHDTPSVGWTFMMAVSCTKAMLVMLFFMHLLWEANWKYVLTIPAAMMSVFLLLMLVPDVGCRVNRYSEERLLHAADPHSTQADGEHSGGEQHGPGHDSLDGGADRTEH
jgi:cytochrome c oxidase subunit 4